MSGSSLLALKIDTDTLRGTREGVPNLVHALRDAHAYATFLFTVGPDHTGRAIRRVFRRGFLQKVSRTSVLEHYGLRTLLYGTLLPGPHIGRSCAGSMREVARAGFEVGLHTYDHIKWQDFVCSRDRAWTEREMQRGIDAFADVFDRKPAVHGAAGWQMNEAAFELEEKFGFAYASDTRGSHPFLASTNGAAVSCPQLPTTLPTLDELIGVNGATPDDAASYLLQLTRVQPSRGHVYTLHAELEGMRLLPVFKRLLEGWREQGYALVSLAQMVSTLDRAALPRHRVVEGTVPGRSGTLACQGAAISAAATTETAH